LIHRSNPSNATKLKNKFDKKKIQSHFSDLERVKEYEQVYRGKTSMGSLRQDLVFRLVKKVIPKKAHVLEVGCGWGELSHLIRTDEIQYTGLDASPEMIKHAVKKNGEGVKFLCCDLFNFKPPKSFNVIVANGVIPYYQNQVLFLKQLREFLVDDGFVVVTHRNAIFNLTALNAGTLEFFKDELLDHYPEASKKELISALSSQIPELSSPQNKSSSSKVYRSSQNPLSIEETYLKAGFSLEGLKYCFIHPSPPRTGENFQEEMLRITQNCYEDSWEGLFLGSQFAVLARCT
jgi:2-polyprenyl-3-methyl-5-hydroxy-6-metoxy-1,4-benzoquinol methylase